MALKTNLENLDGVDEALKEHYSQNPRTGKWIVDVEGFAEQIGKLNGESKRQRERAEAAEAKLAAMEDPERLTRLEAAVAEARSSEAKAIIDTSILSALDRASATAEGVNLLAEKLAALVQIDVDENGRRLVTVTGLDGVVLQGGYKALVDQARDKWPGCFLSNSGSGGGAPTKGGHVPAGGNTISRAQFEALPPAAQAGKIAAGMTVVD